MKNLIIAFLFLPALAFGQYGIKNCHTDLVFGYDYGNRINFEKNNFPDYSVSSLQTLRVGANVNYPISNRWILVSGIRVSSRFSSEVKIWEINPDGIPIEHLQVNTKDFNAEIPFRFRYILKNINRENRLYLEGGTQFNFYIFSHWKEKYPNSNTGQTIEEKIERSNDVREVYLTSNLSFGWETKLDNGPVYFVQTIGKLELIPADYYNANAYYVGIETGLRF